MKRFLKEMIGIMGLTMFVSSQSPVIAAEASSANLLLETQISNVQTFEMPTEEQITLIDGWRQDDDGNTTYIKDGELVQNQVLEIDGNYYGFDSTGVMYRNTGIMIWDEENQKDIYYRIKGDGRLYVNEWYKYDGWDIYGHSI